METELSPISRDHPRGCGEKKKTVDVTCDNVGSSPRVRGKVVRSVLLGACLGIIPAGAGKRSPGARTSLVVRDHPRGCGEKMVR